MLSHCQRERGREIGQEKNRKTRARKERERVRDPPSHVTRLPGPLLLRVGEASDSDTGAGGKSADVSAGGVGGESTAAGTAWADTKGAGTTGAGTS